MAVIMIVTMAVIIIVNNKYKNLNYQNLSWKHNNNKT